MEKRVKFLTAYVVFSTIIFGSLLLMSFKQNSTNKVFDELTLKRLNIVSENGELRLVLSNENRQHPGRINGKDLELRERPAGILFFNTEGDECGGLTYYGKTYENGISQSGMSFTMDQYKEDQVIQIVNGETYEKGNSKISRGIVISDIPTGSDLLTRMDKIKEIQEKIKKLPEIEQKKLIEEVGNSLSSKQRVFIGRTKKNDSGLFLSGPDGKQKLRIYVDDKGIAKLEVLNNDGEFKNLLELNR